MPPKQPPINYSLLLCVLHIDNFYVGAISTFHRQIYRHLQRTNEPTTSNANETIFEHAAVYIPNGNPLKILINF